MIKKILLTAGICLAIAGLGTTSASAAPTGLVDLGQSAPYAVMSGASVANVVSAPGAPHTTVRGDLGVKADAAPSGFPPGVVTGSIRHGSSVDAAHADASTAYGQIAGRTGGTDQAGALVGVTLLPGLYKIAGAASNTGTLTLDGNGDPDAVFVFQVGGALSFAALSHVVLTGKAQASRVFWQVNGAGALGAGSTFAGTLIASAEVGVGNGTIVNGRAFALGGAMTLDDNQFYSAPPVVTIDGGAAAQTTDTTPTISGTTDVEAPGTVAVNVAGQTLTATPSSGTWSVTSAILANGTYPVTASTTDGAGNEGTASQQLTVDTVPPQIALDGGPSVTTNDATPTISGTTDAAVDTVIHVTLGSQNLRALVHAGGVWNIRAATLTDGTYAVSASVIDPAGNESTDTQQLTVDTTAPVATIAGGATRLTNDPTPDITGTATGATGATVSLDVNNETLNGIVDGSGNWTVTASQLADGPHRLVLSVSDVAGNRSTATQMLTVDTVAPQVMIDGGATASTTDTSPTLSGTSDAAPGTTATVTVASQSLTTLLQANGTWNTNPGVIGNGNWQVVASVADPAGNVGTATQALEINPTVTAPTFQLSVSRTGNGQGSISSTPGGIACGSDCSGVYSEGTTVDLTATPATGSDFSGWNGACSGSSTCTASMDQDRTAAATFVLQKRTLTSNRTGNGVGEVTSSPAGSQFDYGTTVTLSANPAQGSTFTGWDGACSGTSECTVRMDQARTVVAGFSDKPPTMTGLKVAPGKVHVGGRSKTSMRRLGPAVRLSLSEAAKVRFSLTRKSAKAVSFTIQLEGGSNSARLPVKIRKKLRKGSYTLSAIATDSAGQASQSATAKFTCVA